MVGARMATGFLVAALAGCAGPPVDQAGPSAGREGVEAISSKLTAASLPGGTSLEVGITSPTSGVVVPPGVVAVNGTAQVGLAPPVADTSILYVMDVSGSTTSGGGCGGDANGDGSANTVLDCEVAALRAVNGAVISASTVAKVGLVVFGSSGAAADVGGEEGEQALTPPASDGDVFGGSDVEQALASARPGGVDLFTPRDVSTSTSFTAAINAAAPVLASMTTGKKIVVFLSDGLDAPGSTLAGALSAVDPSVIFYTFAVGSGSACTAPLNLIAAHGSSGLGTCTHVTDLATLPDVVPAVIAAHLDGLSLTVDAAPVSAPTVTPALPQTGPAAVTFTSNVSLLSAGPHQICATATGSDGAGSGQVTDCVTVVVNSPPLAVCQSLSLVAGPSCQASGSIDGGSSDPDGDPFVCVQTPPSPYSLGTRVVTLVCTDSHGGVGTCSASVKVTDKTPPVFTSVPGPMTISVCKNAAIGTAVASDGCSNPVTVINNAPAVFPLGNTVVTWTARDAAGNAVSATQVVTAILGDDPSCCPPGTHVILGTNGDDTLVGTPGSDCILLRGGRDTCNAFGGNDYISGGSGDDVIDSGDGDDVVFAGSGNDTVFTGNGNDRLDGGPGTDTCNAGGGSNVVTACEIVP
jgi:hypothetical protein